MGDEKGYVTDRADAVYGDLAKGEIGLIITGYQYVLTNGLQLPYMLGNYEEGQLPGLKQLADLVHSHNGKIIPQLVHTGIRANKKLLQEGDEVWAPSAIPDSVTKNVPREVGKTEIHKLIDSYAAAADRSKRAGFDGVQLHGAHGYGINQFISPAWNKRTDAYGGNTKKRYRFLGEVMEAVKGAVGDDFPVLIKLNGNDFVEDGLRPEESLEIAKRLVDDGIAAIEVSAGGAASPPELSPVRKKIKPGENEGYLLDISQFFKENLGIPIIAVGGIRSIKTAEDILSEGKADFISMSRPFVREPDLISRWKRGDLRPATCISCNGCFESGLEGLGISCKVDRRLREKSRGDKS